MKKVKVFSILLACLMAVALVSCDDSVSGGGSSLPNLNGTWVGTFDGLPWQFVFTGNSFVESLRGMLYGRGTFTQDATILIFSYTNLFCTSCAVWVIVSGVLATCPSCRSRLVHSPNPEIMQYSVSGNILTLRWSDFITGTLQTSTLVRSR